MVETEELGSILVKIKQDLDYLKEGIDLMPAGELTE